MGRWVRTNAWGSGWEMDENKNVDFEVEKGLEKKKEGNAQRRLWGGELSSQSGEDYRFHAITRANTKAEDDLNQTITYVLDLGLKVDKVGVYILRTSECG